MRARLKNSSGFTIVELLIVIVVIAVLASISVVAYTGVQSRASNAIRSHEVQQWRQIFQLYKAQYGSFPNVPTGYYCLGTGFPGNYCRDYWAGEVTPNSYNSLDADNATLLNELKKVAPTLPTHNPKPVQNSIVGPYVYYWGDGFNLSQPFDGGPSDCPSGMTYAWDNGGGILICEVHV